MGMSVELAHGVRVFLFTPLSPTLYGHIIHQMKADYYSYQMVSSLWCDK